MKREFIRAVGLAAIAAGALAAAAPVEAATFASFSMISSKTNLKWTRSGSKDGVLDSTLTNGNPGVSSVRFTFLDPNLGISSAKANFSLHASETGHAATGAGGAVGAPLDEPGIGGTFLFTYAGPAYTDGYGHHHNTGDTLLSAVFTLADITSNVKSSSASFLDSTDTAGHSITYASQWMSFTHSIERDFAFNITSVTPTANASAGRALNTFKGSTGGSFSAAFVPEPTTWAMMIAGMGMLGLVARRRRAGALTTA